MHDTPSLEADSEQRKDIDLGCRMEKKTQEYVCAKGK